MSDVADVNVHWGSEAVDPTARDLPGLKMRFLLDQIGTSGSVMEIGCGEGKILRTLATQRPGLRLSGCDVREPATAPDCYTFHLVDHGVPVGAGSFDAVLIFDVLEHVPDPATMLEDAARLLRPGGRLIAFVPVEGEPRSFYSLFRRLLGPDTYEVTKEHIQSFRHSELRRLVERHFRVSEWHYAYHPFGHFMDASFFAAARTKFVRRFWWQENSYYNATGGSNRLSRMLNQFLRVGNLIAFYESKALRRQRFGAAGALFAAEVRRRA